MTREQMKQARLDHKTDKLDEAIEDAEVFVRYAKANARLLSGAGFDDARSELANASNAIDDAMGMIDELMAPERTREDEYDS